MVGKPVEIITIYCHTSFSTKLYQHQVDIVLWGKTGFWMQENLK